MYTKGQTITVNTDETNGADSNDQLATALNQKLGGDWWWTNGELNYSEHGGHGVEVQVCPRDEFDIFARELAEDSNNPEPTVQDIQHDIDENYVVLIWDGKEYILNPQV